jgi:hypothetical protein
MKTTTLPAVHTHKCKNEHCLTQLKQDDECYVYDCEEYCSFKCVEKTLLKEGFSKKEIKTLNKELAIFYTTFEIK